MKGRPPWQTLAPTIDCLTGVGRVEQHGVDHSTAPVPAARWARDAVAKQAPADPGERQALVPDPGEDLADNPGCVLIDLIPGGPSARLTRDIAVAERRAGEDADGTALGPVALAAPTALEHLGPLVFGKHALELQQQAVLRRVSDRAIEEDDLCTGAGELLEQEDLMRVAAGEAVWGVDVDNIDRRQGHEVTQSLQGRSDQTGAAVAVVDEQHVLADLIAILPHSGFQLGKLAIDSVALSLLIGRDTSVEGHLQIPWRRGYSEMLGSHDALLWQALLVGSEAVIGRAMAASARRPGPGRLARLVPLETDLKAEGGASPGWLVHGGPHPEPVWPV